MVNKKRSYRVTPRQSASMSILHKENGNSIRQIHKKFPQYSLSTVYQRWTWQSNTKEKDWSATNCHWSRRTKACSCFKEASKNWRISELQKAAVASRTYPHFQQNSTSYSKQTWLQVFTESTQGIALRQRFDTPTSICSWHDKKLSRGRLDQADMLLSWCQQFCAQNKSGWPS